MKLILNIILKLYFLMDMIIVCGHKMKRNRLIKKESTDKEESIDLSDMPPLEGD